MGIVVIIILLPYLFVACDSTPAGDFTPITALPTPVATVLPEGVKEAWGEALTYIDNNYDIELPMSDADWMVEYDFLLDSTGSGAYRLTADSCVVTISNPLLGLGSSLYHVILDDAAAGFHWEGDVDCQGQVLSSFSTEHNLNSSVPESINIVKMAGLTKTVGIEVCRLDCASYTPFFTIGNDKLIADLVRALDTEVLLRPHARCPATYQLRFILADGQHYDFGYACQMVTPTYLRGNQEFWLGQDAIAPDAFNELMLPLIAQASGTSF
jgi:hypothetical protein